MPLPKLRRGSSHQTSRRAERVRKISSKDTAKMNNLANKISLRVKNSRQAGLKAYFKAILKKLPNRKQIEMQIRDQGNILQDKALVDPNGPTRNTLPLLLSPNVMYSLHCTGSRLENHFELLIMWHKQPESISHVFSRPLSCINRKTWDEQMAQQWG
jgi:hypothetical protein